MKKIFIHVLSFALLTIYAYQSKAQIKYCDYSVSEKKLLLSESFDENSKNWITNNDWLSGELSGSIYSIKCKNFKNSTGISCIETAIDNENDFEIEANIKVIKGSGVLVFGMADNYDHCRIELKNNKQFYIVLNQISKDKLDILFKLKVEQLKPNNFNKISIRKVNKFFYLFVNEVFVKNIGNIDLFGNKVGFGVGPHSEIKADDLKISLIKHSLPAFAWRNPFNEDSTVHSDHLIIEGLIGSESSIKSVQLVTGSNSVNISVDSLKTSNTNNQYIFKYKLLLKTGSNTISLKVTNTGGTITSEIRNINYEPIVPPVITWMVPIHNDTVKSKDYSIKLCVKSANELDFVEVILNGFFLLGSTTIIPVNKDLGGAVFELSVTLKPGTNSIYAEATNSVGKTSSETRYLTYNSPEKVMRLALVIGNSKYPGGMKLKNPVNDAKLMAKTLRGLDFEVIMQTDANKISMDNAIRKFSDKLKDYKVALFYYAGHGVQVKGINYLIPVDAGLENEDSCVYEAINVNTVVEKFDKYQDNINIIILDACRNNPYRSWSRGFLGGFKAMDPASGSIIAFATSEGSTAADGENANGLYTEELVKQMVIPQEIESVFKKTRVVVEKGAVVLKSLRNGQN